jgi:hypothetical protein
MDHHGECTQHHCLDAIYGVIDRRSCGSLLCDRSSRWSQYHRSVSPVSL